VAIIGFLRWMPVARLVRAQFLSIKEREYIEAARSVGVPGQRMIFVHMLPNAISPVIVAGSLAVAAAILTESALSFLGLGFPPTIPPGAGCSSTQRISSRSSPGTPSSRA